MSRNGTAFIPDAPQPIAEPSVSMELVGETLDVLRLRERELEAELHRVRGLISRWVAGVRVASHGSEAPAL